MMTEQKHTNLDKRQRPRGTGWITCVQLFAAVCLGFLGFLGTGTTAEAASTRISRVVIDAGHGGHDSGAKRGYVLEKHLALDVTRRLERYLERRKMRCVQTRNRDTFIPLSQRSKIANRYRDAVFVSVHFNWAYNSEGTGTETFYNKNSSLASAIQTRVARKAGTTNRGTKRASFYVLRHTDIPAALVECGFISNYDDRRRCLDPRYRQKIAEAIGEGILAYSRG